jgi:hypothetical protein
MIPKGATRDFRRSTLLVMHGTGRGIFDQADPAQNVAAEIFGYMAGKVKIVGDVVGRIAPLEDWSAVDSAAPC